MAPNIPEKQWAMVIEKTGGPVDYKEIPGMPNTTPLHCEMADLSDSCKTRPGRSPYQYQILGCLPYRPARCQR